MGYASPPGVIHSVKYRDSATGFHTNEAGSENNRLKKWNRQRYGTLTMNEDEMAEYVFYVNLGSSFSSVMHGLAASSHGNVDDQ